MSESSEKLSNLAMMAMDETIYHLKEENERLRIRCDGYQASRDWTINQLACALHLEPDTVRAVEYYARFATEEIKRLRAERDTFYMDYRLKCDEETKRLEGELQNCRNKLKASGRAKLREELDAAKALLREAIGYTEIAIRLSPGWQQHPEDVGKNRYQIHATGREFIKRIRAALGDEP